MKKVAVVLIVLLLSLTLSGCGSSSNSSSSTSTSQASNQSESKKGATWPEEFDKWGVPILSKATIVTVGDTSVSGGVITKGVNIVVNLKDVSKADFDAYCKELEAKSYEKSPDSLPDVMLYYEKVVEGGIIKLTLSYSEEATTIIVNNSAAAAAKDAVTSGKTEWPTSAKDVPEFTKGKYKETIDMGSGMYSVTFTGVTSADVDWYTTTVKNAGYEKDESTDTETYGKRNGNTMNAVGFALIGDTLQIMLMSATE